MRQVHGHRDLRVRDLVHDRVHRRSHRGWRCGHHGMRGFLNPDVCWEPPSLQRCPAPSAALLPHRASARGIGARCCGPKADGTGAGKELAATILYILAGIVHFVGAVLALLWYLALAEDVKKHCDDLCKDWETDWWAEYESRAECDAYYDQTCKDYESATLGFLAILIFPTVAFCVACGILEIIGAVLCFKAKKAVEASAGGAAAAKDANPVNV
eukprot:Transcript_287.p2 GENE.Transcript_287~~Transcript_287.p2  ORF type:complete len:246 (-),score=57.55 Transcript_287:209-850(-)